jgi:UDP-N-acetylmuramoylalanine--D-glutamate ligase
MFNSKVNYAVLGSARSGLAAAYKIRDLGGNVFLSEVQPVERINNGEKIAHELNCEFGGHTDKLFDYDLWIVSPGIPLDSPIIMKGQSLGIKMISEIEFGYQIKANDSRIIAVTGSNGKSTTASQIHHILKNMGFESILAGNIGSAFCSHPIELPGVDFIVLEISSFQLDLIDKFRPDVSVLLNITPDHMNRYSGFDAYASSKFRIFENQTPQDTAVICVDSDPIVKKQDQIKAKVKRYSLVQRPPDCDAWLNGEFIQIGIRHKLNVKDLKIKGNHNYSNTMASLLSVAALNQSIDLAMEEAKGFAPLTHRLEYVETIKGILFYNDSKATNTDSVKSALTSFEKKIRIIMGGSEKGEDYNTLTPLLSKWAKKIYLTGDTKNRMQEIWQGKIPLTCIDDFEACVRKAYEESTAGDIIVLSPACASFDKFKNFEHRGETFKNIVMQIAKENEEK